jgi:hypothetical protein
MANKTNEVKAIIDLATNKAYEVDKAVATDDMADEADN